MESIQIVSNQVCKQINLKNQIAFEIPYMLSAEQEEEAVKIYFRQIFANGSEITKAKHANKNFLLPDWKLKKIKTRYNNAIYWENKQKEFDKIVEIKKIEARKLIIEKWNALFFLNFIQHFSKIVYSSEPLIYKQFLNSLCLWMAKDIRFEQVDAVMKCGNNLTKFRKDKPGDLKKGLLVWGVYGAGKTYPIKTIAENELSKILVFSMVEIYKQLKNTGSFYLPNTYGCKIYIDDVGREPNGEILSYGQKYNWFEDFIEQYYFDDKDFSNLIISTNLNFEELTQKYGGRIVSRLHEKFNIIQLNGIGDRRMIQ
jgi:DNA replication protein DnaC